MKFREFTASVILTCWVSVWLLGCSKKEEAPAAPPVVAQAPDPEPTVDEGIVALLRSHPHSKKVCYDSEWGYYIFYSVLPDGAADDGMLHGTFLVQNIKFRQSANKTWFNDAIAENKYITVYPDVINLPCKDQQ